MKSLLAKMVFKTQPRWARNEDPPFARGVTFYNGATPDNSNPPSSLAGTNIVGKTWVFEDTNPTGTLQRTNYYVTCVAVRNINPLPLLPGFVCLADLVDAGAQRAHADGLVHTTASDFLGVVDEYLPIAGCPQNDICWVVIDGPTVCYTDLAGGANNLIPLNTRVVALTAATSGATTAGRVAPQVITDSTTIQGVLNAAQVQNVIGRALTAMTTAQTNSPVLIFVTDR